MLLPYFYCHLQPLYLFIMPSTLNDMFSVSLVASVQCYSCHTTDEETSCEEQRMRHFAFNSRTDTTTVTLCGRVPPYHRSPFDCPARCPHLDLNQHALRSRTKEVGSLFKGVLLPVEIDKQLQAKTTTTSPLTKKLVRI